MVNFAVEYREQSKMEYRIESMTAYTTIDGFIKSNAAVLNDLAKEVPSGMGRPAPKIWIFGARA
jgi:hypothetical protein